MTASTVLAADLRQAADRARANERHVGAQVQAMVRGQREPGVDYSGLAEALHQYAALLDKAADRMEATDEG